ncbi:hypothetical protein Bca52824_064575 [Brassica carinata]|uniref:Uncharacterized protein n=1 Tax=Brassica carinata TaxID=52824 RepID=A0A8X7QGS6_BRACI|nr:hypothetical protein Bca52824_064575 [Brassica carinata]
MVEEAVDTAVEAVVVMEAMVEDMCVDTMVVVGGGGGYGGGDGGDHRNGGCGVRWEGSYSGGVSGSTRLPSMHLMSTRLPSTHLSSTHLPSTHLSLVQNEFPFTSGTRYSFSTYHQTHLIHLHL